MQLPWLSAKDPKHDKLVAQVTERSEVEFVSLRKCREYNRPYGQELDFLPGHANSKWARRGWTLQEGILPWRTLTYMKQHVSWRCMTGERYEDNYRVTKNSPFAHWHFFLDGFVRRLARAAGLCVTREDPSEFEMYDNWRHVIWNISDRSFTYPSDRLPAISGLAKIWQIHLKDTYCAGLWKANLAQGLLWELVVESDSQVGLSDARNFNSSPPSWSWTSCNKLVRQIVTKSDDTYIDTASIDRVDMQYKSSLYGEVTHGSITLTTACYLTNDIEAVGDRHSIFPLFQDHLAWIVAEDREFQERRQALAEKKFAVILISMTRDLETPAYNTRLGFLIVQGVKDAGSNRQGVPQEFRRVGRMILDRFSETRDYAQQSGDIVDELRRTPWPRRTIIIV